MSIPPCSIRESARVVVLDEHDRIVLLRYQEDGHAYWATPGGSLEPGEKHLDAARRELREELGADNIPIGPQIAKRTRDHTLAGRLVRQVEHYYIARTNAADIDPDHATQPDQIQAWHWWTLHELRTATQTVHPTGLAELLRFS